MARPRKPANDLRNAHLNVRLRADEQARLEHMADMLGLTVAEFVRRRGLGYRMPPVISRQKANEVAVMALIGIGNNLNQLTRYAHAGRGLALNGLLESTIARVNAAIEDLHGPRDQPSGPGV